MSYNIPDARFELPELLRPRRKPVGQTTIDWNNSVTRDLGQFFSLTPTAIDEKVTGIIPTGMAGRWEGTGDGIGWRTSADGHYIRYPWHSNQAIDADFTVWWRGKIYGEVAGPFGLMGNRVGTLTDGEWFMSPLGELATDEFRFVMRDNATTNTACDAGNNWPGVHPELYDIYLTQQNSGSFKLYLYYNNSLYTETETIGGIMWPFVTANQPLMINELNDQLISAVDAVFLCGAIWHRALFDEEVARLHTNPYQFLTPV